MNKYADIINFTRPKSKRVPMSIEARAAQFAPFSALTGYNEAIMETGRFTDRKNELSDGLKDVINEKLLFIKNSKFKGEVKIKYFIPDTKKMGGKYCSIVSGIRKIDSTFNFIVLDNGLKIEFSNIYDIDCEVFNFYDL